MLDQKYVTFYARSRRVPLDVAERDVVLTYVLKVLLEDVLKNLAFKGGTCLKKMHFGGSGRFSMDLDFTSLDISTEDLQAKIKQLLDKQSHFGVNFKILDENLRKGDGACEQSYLAVLGYSHSWNSGEFMFEVSFREKPLLPLDELPFMDELYFKYTEFLRFPVRCLHKEELLAEKLRAAYQRFRARDLYDLYLFADRHFDKSLVQKLAVIKCWNVREPFNPKTLLHNIATSKYDWTDLERLVRKDELPSEEAVIGKVLKTYAFLADMDRPLVRIIDDSKAHKETKLVAAVLGTLKADSKG
jgi:predicted nucleotidyltransferase component of viral defense system